MSWLPLSPPAMSFQGEWGPLWAVPTSTALCFSVRPAVASLSGLLWLLGAEGPGARAVTSSRAALYSGVFLGGGSCFVCPWVCPLILSCLGKHSCGPVCRLELTLAADLRPCLERLACCSQGWLSAWSQEAGHSFQTFLIF